MQSDICRIINYDKCVDLLTNQQEVIIETPEGEVLKILDCLKFLLNYLNSHSNGLNYMLVITDENVVPKLELIPIPTSG